MPLGLYGAWLPMRMYGSGGASGVPMLPAHTSASYPSHQDLYQNRLSQHLGSGTNHLQGAAYPTACQRGLNHRGSTSFTDSEDDGSIDSPASPAHDLSKSRHGKFLRKTYSVIFVFSLCFVSFTISFTISLRYNFTSFHLNKILLSDCLIELLLII